MRFLALFLLTSASVLSALVGMSALMGSRYVRPAMAQITRSKAISAASAELVSPKQLSAIRRLEASAAKTQADSSYSSLFGWLALASALAQVIAAVLIFLRRAVRLTYGLLAAAFVALLAGSFAPGGGLLLAGAAVAVALAALAGWRVFTRRGPPQVEPLVGEAAS